MGQGQIRKGFFFYFGLLVLMLVAVFMICVVIMMFNPGQSILWMEYFTDNTTEYVDTTTDDDTAITWSAITNVEVECSYADVIVERDNNRDYTKTGLYIVNNAKGFATSSSAVDFDYSVTLSGTDTLIIKITEPKGFLYFSKNIKVILHACSIDSISSDSNTNNTTNFQGTTLKVTTTDGDVELGGSYNIPTNAVKTKLKGVDITTGSGNIYFTENMYFNDDGDYCLTSIDFTTSSGKIYSNKSVSYTLNGTDKTATGIDASCDVTLSTTSGRIDLDVIKTTGDVTISRNSSGNVVLGDVISSTLAYTECSNGNYKLNNFSGTSVTFGSDNSVDAPNIVFGNIDGSFSMITVESSAPTIKITKLTGALTLTGNCGGSLTVGEADGSVSVGGKALSVNIVLGESNTSTVQVTTTSGSVRLGFMGTTIPSTGTPSGVNVYSTSGAVTIDIVSTAKFTATMYKSDKTTAMSSSKVTLNIGEIGEISEVNDTLTLPVNQSLSGTNGTMTLCTDGNVKFNVVTTF